MTTKRATQPTRAFCLHDTNESALITRNINVLKKCKRLRSWKKYSESIPSARLEKMLCCKKRQRERETVDELGRVKGGGTGAYLISVHWLADKIEVYRCGTPGIKGKPPSLYNRKVTYVCEYLITGFQRAQDQCSSQKKKTSLECVHDLSWRSQGTKRENVTSTEPWNDSLFEDQYRLCPAASDAGNKK